MKRADRIGVLLFLHSRHELSEDENRELLVWRQKSPENEKLFQNISDPEYVRGMMKELYRQRDRGFEKLKVEFPDMADVDLYNLDDSHGDLEGLRLEEERRMNFPEKDIAESGLSKVEFWALMLRKEEIPKGIKGAENGKEDGPVKVIALNVWKSHWTVRVACVIVGIFLALNVVNFLFFDSNDSRYKNYEARMVSPDGVVTIVNDFNQGLQDGKAGIRHGIKTERGEPVRLASNERERGRNEFYDLSTYPGKEFILQLPDGTRVWMNSVSKIKYPASFYQDTIRIQIEGEAYFEISKDTTHHYLISTVNRQPSTVNRQPSTIIAQPSSALNINTFDNELLVTLFRGGATANWDTAGIHPENQFQLMNGKMTVVKNDTLTGIRDVDTSETIAWKNGEIYYKDTTLPAMMPAIARWYDVDVVYTGRVPDKKFSLRIPRSEPLSGVLDMLKKQGLKIALQGKTVTIWE